MIDAEKHVVPGARDVRDVLANDPIVRVLGSRLANPVVLGLVAFAIVLVTIVFGPSSDTRFIYTAF